MPSLSPTLDSRPADLTVLTYNVHSCIGTDRRLDLARIADVIAAERPDVIALQELDVGRARTGGVDQAERIADALRMTPHFHPSVHIENEKYGDAILTALPSRLVKAGAIPSVGETRGAVWVEVMVGGRAVQIVNTHFGLRRGERLEQARTLLGSAWVGSAACRDQPVVLTGDFNAIPSSAAYRMIRTALRPALVAGRQRIDATFPSRFPLLRLDHIFVSPHIETLEAGRVRTSVSRVASDHLPLKAVLRIGR